MRWTSGGSLQAGLGKPSDGVYVGVTAGTVAGTSTDAYLGNLNGLANRSLGGEYEVAAFDRRLSDSEIDGVVDALSLADLAPGDAYLYPRPAAGVADGAEITDPSTQIIDESAHGWTISTVDGTSAIQAKL